MFCLDSGTAEDILMMPPTLYTFPIQAPLSSMAPLATSNTTWYSMPSAGMGVPPAMPHAALPVSLPPATYPGNMQQVVLQEPTSPSPGALALTQAFSPTPTPGSNYPMSVTMRMEIVWHGEFDRFFARLPHVWTLEPLGEEAIPPSGDQYTKSQDSAKVRFCCNDCGRGWTSMKGRVGFWFTLDPATNFGRIMFKLYGQKCQRCMKDDSFSHAMWYPEEVVKVIENLYNKVASTYYGMALPLIRYDRRGGKPRAQHDAKLCQACKDGICKEGWSMS